MPESLRTKRCLAATNRVPQVRKDLGHPALVIVVGRAHPTSVILGFLAFFARIFGCGEAALRDSRTES